MKVELNYNEMKTETYTDFSGEEVTREVILSYQTRTFELTETLQDVVDKLMQDANANNCKI